MIARERLRNREQDCAERLAARGLEAGVLERWRLLDETRRSSLVAVEELKRQRNQAGKEIGRRKSQGEDASEQIEAMAALKTELEALETTLGEAEEEFLQLELEIPNLPHPSVPLGADESANRVERLVGDLPEFSFAPQPHWDLAPALGIVDFERGAKLAGARFSVQRGAGARLERALAGLMLDLHTTEHGYLEVSPPYLAHQDSMTASGQLPKFAEDSFRIEGHPYFLIPTSEVPLANLHRSEILAEDDLPLRYTALTPCFRSEAGSYGRDVRGLIRQHQFHKVELVQYVRPEESYAALDELTGHAERVLQVLEIPYQVVCLSSGDMGFAAAKTYDLEVWLPGLEEYREISSCSNCEDFQARRGSIRFRSESKKPSFVHTLNGSGLAVGRTLIAVLENYQQADGTIRVPEALRPYMGGLEVITGP